MDTERPIPKTLADHLSARFPTAKRTTLRRMVADGRVLLNGEKVIRFNTPITPADVIVVDEGPQPLRGTRVGPDGRRQPRTDPKRPNPRSALNIVHEDADVLVVNKPSGLLTSTVPDEPRPTLLAKVEAYLMPEGPKATPGGVRVGLIHRLDREAGGLLVFSKNDEAYHALKTLFFHHDVQRIYHAIVRGKMAPPAGKIESRLTERADGKVHSTRQVGKGELAVTNYETVRTVGKYTLLKVTLHTGRKHQIRVHLSERGCPIVGDPMYGPPTTDLHRLMLVATNLGFKHPRTGELVHFELDLPKEMKRLIAPT